MAAAMLANILPAIILLVIILLAMAAAMAAVPRLRGRMPERRIGPRRDDEEAALHDSTR